MKEITISLLALVICSCSTKTEPRISVYSTQYASCVEILGIKENYALRNRVLELDNIIAGKVLISEDQIQSYNWSTHEIKLEKGVGKQLPQPNSCGIPILIMANGKKAYIGAIWTSCSSCSTQLPIIDWQDAQDDKFKIKLGYPVEMKIKKDPRENPLK